MSLIYLHYFYWFISHLAEFPLEKRWVLKFISKHKYLCSSGNYLIILMTFLPTFQQMERNILTNFHRSHNVLTKIIRNKCLKSKFSAIQFWRLMNLHYFHAISKIRRWIHISGWKTEKLTVNRPANIHSRQISYILFRFQNGRKITLVIETVHHLTDLMIFRMHKRALLINNNW